MQLTRHVLALLVCTLPACAEERSATGPHDFTLATIDGATVRLSDHSGRVVLLVFFATWSKPSRQALLHVNEVFAERRADGFVVLAIAVDGPDTMGDVPAYRARNGLAFPVAVDQDSHVTAAYNPRRSVPFFVLVDRTGKTTAREGYNPGDETFIRADIEAALR